MSSKALIPILVAMMLLTGVCNTLLTKYQDNICVRNCADPDVKQHRLFEQPVIQTAQMFIGEMGCWLFVGAFSMYRRYVVTTSSSGTKTKRPVENGYMAIDTEDDANVNANGNGNEATGDTDGDADIEDADADADAHSINSTTPINPAMKVMSINTADDRIPLVGWRLLLLSLPAICDICGTTLMNVGLLFVVPSIYQMTRGALVLFVGLFSVIFLRRRLHLFQWFALVTVVMGVAIVGLAGALYKDEKAAPSAAAASAMVLARLRIREAMVVFAREARTPEALRAVVGVFLIAGAQVFTASQFVSEEYILHKYALEPLKVVGWEGLFGFLVTVLGMLVMHAAVGRTEAGRFGYFDLVEGWREVTRYREIGISSILIMISIGGFNFFGLSVTRTVSATSRSTIDTCRTLFIWIVSLFLGWETFKWLQVLGFLLLVYGTFLFNGLVRPPLERWCVVVGGEIGEVEELLPEEPIEHV